MNIPNYKILKEIGAGGMGTVYLAEHTLIKRKVAIKSLKQDLIKNEQLRERFKKEATALAQLEHPNIVRLNEYIEQQDGIFLIMEYVDGLPLDEHINNISGPINEEQLIPLFLQILDAFEYAHKNKIVHRDIKPSNIIITKDGKIKVLDFGIAKIMDETNSMTKTGTQMGSVLYMSPEQVRGEKVNHLSDIYSLGVTLFQMATGKAPYDPNSNEYKVFQKIDKEALPKASSIYPGVSKKLEEIIEKATNKNSYKRFQFCSEFKKVLIKKDLDKTIISEEKKSFKSNQKTIVDSKTKTIIKEPFTKKNKTKTNTQNNTKKTSKFIGGLVGAILGFFGTRSIFGAFLGGFIGSGIGFLFKNKYAQSGNKYAQSGNKYAQSPSKKINEEKSIEITFNKIRKSPLNWITNLISGLSIIFAFLIFLDFKVLPTNTIDVNPISRYSNDLKLIQLNKNREFKFGISDDDLPWLKKKVKIGGAGLSVNGFPFTEKREKLKSTSIFNQIIGMDININKRNVFTIENHNSIYRIFYFYLIILLLPVITLLSRGPNIIYIFSSYMISTISAITMILLFILLLI